MTTLYPLNVICKNCGSPVFARQVMSTNEFGSPDLDLRPAPMRRALIYHLIQHCPECGYTGMDISKEPPEHPDFQKLIKKDCTSDSNNPATERLYELAAQIKLLYTPEDYEAAADLFLKAAWIADDRHDREFAKEMRKKSLFCKMQKGYHKQSTDYKLQMIDIARRAEDFEKATELIEKFPKSKRKDIYEKILIFQQKLVNMKDSDRYLVEDTLPVK